MTRLARDPSPLIEKFYQAALEPGVWESALKDIGLYTPMSGVMFSCCDISDLETEDPTLLIDLDPAAWDLYRSEYIGICPRIKYAMEYKPKSVFYDYQYNDETEIKKSEFYSLLEQHWKTRYCMGAILEISDHIQCHMGIHTTRNQGHPLKTDVAFLNAMTPHIHRALQLSHRITFNNTEQIFDAADFGDKPQGVIVLDGHGRVTFCNRLARSILDRGDGLRIEKRQITALSSYDRTKLNKIIASTINPSPINKLNEPNVLPIGRKTGKHPYRVMVSRLPKKLASAEVLKASAVIFISDPTLINYVPAKQLQQLYGLTQREASLLYSFIKHTSLSTAAEELHMAKNTARTHLQSIFMKTETRSQTELIKLIMSS